MLATLIVAVCVLATPLSAVPVPHAVWKLPTADPKSRTPAVKNVLVTVAAQVPNAAAISPA